MIVPNEAFKKYLAVYRSSAPLEATAESLYRPKILLSELYCCGMAVITNLRVGISSNAGSKGIVCDAISKCILEPIRTLGVYPHRNLFYFAGGFYTEQFAFLEEIGFKKIEQFKNFAHDNQPLYMYGLLNE